MKFKTRVTRMLAAALFGSVAFYASNASALSLKEAMAVALESNPEIGQAVENREAIEFELRQARGLYLPSVDLEASAGSITPRAAVSGSRTTRSTRRK